MTGFFATQTEAATIMATSYLEGGWPSCEGRCHKGVCALRWDHPACCELPERDTCRVRSLGDEAPVNTRKQATADNGAHYDHGHLYCWN